MPSDSRRAHTKPRTCIAASVDARVGAPSSRLRPNPNRHRRRLAVGTRIPSASASAPASQIEFRPRRVAGPVRIDSDVTLGTRSPSASVSPDRPVDPASPSAPASPDPSRRIRLHVRATSSEPAPSPSASVSPNASASRPNPVRIGPGAVVGVLADVVALPAAKVQAARTGAQRHRRGEDGPERVIREFPLPPARFRERAIEVSLPAPSTASIDSAPSGLLDSRRRRMRDVRARREGGNTHAARSDASCSMRRERSIRRRR